MSAQHPIGRLSRALWSWRSGVLGRSVDSIGVAVAASRELAGKGRSGVAWAVCLGPRAHCSISMACRSWIVRLLRRRSTHLPVAFRNLLLRGSRQRQVSTRSQVRSSRGLVKKVSRPREEPDMTSGGGPGVRCDAPPSSAVGSGRPLVRRAAPPPTRRACFAAVPHPPRGSFHRRGCVARRGCGARRGCVACRAASPAGPLRSRAAGARRRPPGHGRPRGALGGGPGAGTLRSGGGALSARLCADSPCNGCNCKQSLCSLKKLLNPPARLP